MDRIYLFGCESFMADITGLGGTTLDYLAVQQAMVSIHKPVHNFENHANLLAYLGKLTAVHPREWLSRHY